MAESEALSQTSRSKPVPIWQNILVLFGTPIAAAIAVPLYGYYTGFSGFEWACFGFFMLATGLSITAGYHRLWSHRAYEAHWSLRLFFAIFGACAIQNSILNWSADHRRHHKHVDDNDHDPYSVNRGFWHAHMGWILFNDRGPQDFSGVKDLQRDPIVMWQHRYNLTLTLLTNIALPLLLGFLTGKLWGVFILATLLRVVLNHHFTFFINSLAHIWGRRPYSEDNSARDNDLLAFLTYGEGYHNYHHRFQYDYRNGIRWWQFDPTKWLIRSASWIGLTSKLRTVSAAQIEKARVAIQYRRSMARLTLPSSTTDELRAKLEQQYREYQQALNDWTSARQAWVNAKRDAFSDKLEQLDQRMRYLEYKYQLKLQRKRWRLLNAQVFA